MINDELDDEVLCASSDPETTGKQRPANAPRSQAAAAAFIPGPIVVPYLAATVWQYRG
jgi:hypothetical protein